MRAGTSVVNYVVGHLLIEQCYSKTIISDITSFIDLKGELFLLEHLLHICDQIRMTLLPFVVMWCDVYLDCRGAENWGLWICCFIFEIVLYIIAQTPWYSFCSSGWLQTLDSLCLKLLSIAVWGVYHHPYCKDYVWFLFVCLS